MKRRTFLKGIALTLLAPKILTQVLTEPHSGGWIPVTSNMIDITVPTHGMHYSYIIMDDPFDVTDLSHVKNIKEWIYAEVHHGEE